MHFRENKRLRDKEDKEILKQFKMDIFDESIPIIRAIRKYFVFSDSVLADKNIAYKSNTCKTFSEMVRKNKE